MKYSNATVYVNDSSANGVALAIKLLRRKLDRAGLTSLILRHESKLYVAQSPSQKLKAKRTIARRRAWRREFRRAQREAAFLEAGGERAAYRNSSEHSGRLATTAGDHRQSASPGSSSPAAAQGQVNAA